jgi:hypothetical protein
MYGCPTIVPLCVMLGAMMDVTSSKNRKDSFGDENRSQKTTNEQKVNSHVIERDMNMPES